MSSHSCNKLIAASSALAAAGILTCAAALLDVFIPRGSLLGSCTRMALLGLAAIGAVIGYNWVCDKCEDYFNDPLDRHISGGQSERKESVSPEAPVGPRPTEPKADRNGRPASDASQHRSRVRYTSTLRGSVSPKRAAQATGVRAWHGL